MPQQNHLAELGLAALVNRGRAMLIKANVPMEWRPMLWTEAFKMATLLDGLSVITIDGVSDTRCVHWCGENPAFASHLRTWGEAGMVKIKTKMTPKLANHGVQCMFVGHALNHPGDCCHMWNKNTRRMHETRDVVWLKRMYFEKNEADKNVAIGPLDLDLDLDSEAGKGNENDDDEPDDDDNEEEADVDDDAEKEADQMTTRSSRIVKAPTRLVEEMSAKADDCEIKLTEAETNCCATMHAFPEGKFEPGEVACVGAGLGGGFVTTKELHVMKCDEAMVMKDAPNWRKAAKEEYDRMVKHGVFKEVPRDQAPEGAKILSSAWAMKKKVNGVYRARLNARGFEQVDGEHCNEDDKAAPVVNDAAIHIALVLVLMAGWWAEILDARGAFSHGEFEEGQEVHMDAPQGFERFCPKKCGAAFVENFTWCETSSDGILAQAVGSIQKDGFRAKQGRSMPVLLMDGVWFGALDVVD